jgi:putative oxidoreductase
MGFPFPAIAEWPTGVWMIAAGVSIALGVYGDVAALMIAPFVIPAAWWLHALGRSMTRGRSRWAQLLFWHNVTFLGAPPIIFVLFAAFGYDLALTITDPLFDLRN